MSNSKQNNQPTSQPLHNLIADPYQQRQNRTRIDRRRFVQGVGVGIAGVGLTACKTNDTSVHNPAEVEVSFNHGIASGDPLSDRVILWTRVTPAAQASSVAVHWHIASDEQFGNVIQQGVVHTSAKHDFTVKVDATGLQPNSRYYYQFWVGNQKSIAGQTKTLPIGDVSQVKLAVFSCANYPAGYFHAYADAAQRGDVDVAVHLGDYIYEYARYDDGVDEFGNPIPAYASANAKKLNREVNPSTETISIQDYRLRHAQYRTDPDLQALHAQIPMIAVWDDHEISNDTYKDGAENHQANEGDWHERKMAAMTAYHEWLPTRNQVVNTIYRSFDFGNLLSLHMLDTRVIGRDEQLDYNHYLKPDSAGQLSLDAERFRADMSDTNRQLLGIAQQNWLAQQMQSSTATWQVLGQQILMGRMSIPSPILLNFNDSSQGMDALSYIQLKSKASSNPASLTAAEKAILAQPYIPYNLDAWDGYYMARENVLGLAKALQKNLVVLSGDTHNAWANNLTDHQGNAVGVEFATSSVSSPGFEQYMSDIPPALFAMAIPNLIEAGTLKYANTHERGYMLVTVTADKCQADWVFVSDILKTEHTNSIGKSMSVNVGENKLT